MLKYGIGKLNRNAGLDPGPGRTNSWQIIPLPYLPDVKK
jgi:hypothetical protein